MAKRPNFITLPEWEQFNIPNRCMSRKVHEITQDSIKHQDPKVLDETVLHLLRERLPRGDSSQMSWFGWASFLVKEGDGMSWSAEKTMSLLNEHFGHFSTTSWSALGQSNNTLPLIADWIGHRKFYKLVEKHNFSREFPMLRWWGTWAIWILAIAATSVLKFVDVRLDQLFLNIIPESSTLFSLSVYGTLLTFFGVTSQMLANHLTTRPQRAAIRELRETIEGQAATKSQAFFEFIDELAATLIKGHFPRVFVVDNFERLDLITRKALERYLACYLSKRSGGEYWFIFELPSGDRLSLYNFDSRGGTLFRPVRIFEQIPLSTEERHLLAERLGKIERESYTTVKIICGPDLDSRGKYVEMLRNYNMLHPPAENLYSDLHLLFLLSLNSFGGCGDLTQDFIVSIFSRKEGLRSDILRSLLKGTNLRVDEFSNSLRRLGQTLRSTPLVSVKEGSGAVLFSVHEETSMAFAESKVEFQLPNEGLGQAFWAIFWFEQLRSHPIQAFWIRKLCAHLLRSDLTAFVARDLYPDASIREIEAIIYAVNGALQTCIYEPVSELLQRAVSKVVSEDHLNERLTLSRDLMKACLYAYKLTGSDEAFGSYLRLRSLGIASLPSESASPSTFQLFIDLLPMSGNDRKRLAGAPNKHELDGDLLLFGDLLATYFAMKVSDAVGNRNVPHLENLVTVCRNEAGEAIPRFVTQISATPFDQIVPSDILNLSVAIDIIPHLLRHELASQSFGAQIFQLATSILSESAHSQPHEMSLPQKLQEIVAGLHSHVEPKSEVFELFLDASETAILIAQEFSGNLGSYCGTHLVLAALARELYCIVLSNLVLTLHALDMAKGSLRSDWIGRVQNILAMLSEQIDLSGIKDFNDLANDEARHHIDRQHQHAAFVWKQFGLPNIALYSHVRRIDLIAAYDHLKDAFWGLSAPLRDALNEPESEGKHSRIAGFLALSHLFGDSAELRADHLLQACAQIVSGSYGAALKRDFAWLAISFGHSLAFDLSIYLDFLVLGLDLDGQSNLKLYLDSLEENLVETTVLQLLNAISKSSRTALLEDVREAVNGSMGGRTVEARESVSNLFDFYLLKNTLNSAADVSPIEVIERWREKNSAWLLAGVLNLLISRGHLEDLIVEEARNVLRETQPNETTFNTHYLLALSLADVLIGRGDELDLEELPMSYIRASIARWERMDSAELNTAAYLLLHKAYGGSSSPYRPKAEYWNVIKYQHDEAAKLLPMMKDGQFFSIFFYYFKLLSDWGLPTDLESDVFRRSLRVSAAQRLQKVKEWKQDGGRVPMPFYERIGGRCVLADFVIIGRFLFDPPLLGNADFDDDRRRFDASAGKNIRRLLELSSTASGLPVTIRDLISGYAVRFERYTFPKFAS